MLSHFSPTFLLMKVCLLEKLAWKTLVVLYITGLYCPRQDHLFFDNELYKQIDAAAMGSP